MANKIDTDGIESGKEVEVDYRIAVGPHSGTRKAWSATVADVNGAGKITLENGSVLTAYGAVKSSRGDVIGHDANVRPVDGGA